MQHSIICDYISEGSVSISTCNEHNYALLQQYLKSSRDNKKSFPVYGYISGHVFSQSGFLLAVTAIDLRLCVWK